LEEKVPRIARVVVPNVPHHVTQRGNRRQRTFFSESDYAYYKALLARWCRRRGVAIWCYCLMPNHAHLILVPGDPAALARAVGETHRRYTLAINQREGWTGYLWQGRFASFPMSESHLLNATRYVLLNPVRSGLVRTAREWPHSSALDHLSGRSRGIVDPEPLAGRVGSWDFLLRTEDNSDYGDLRSRQRTGRPLGDSDFVARIEKLTGRRLRRSRPGPKKKNQGPDRDPKGTLT
jgi:putative transposase